MAVGELVVDHIERVLLPLALLILPVPHLHSVEVGLADVVQQAADGDGLLLAVRQLDERLVFPVLPLGNKQIMEAVINVDAVLHQPARMGQVEAGTGRGLEEVRGLQPSQELICSRACDELLAKPNEPIFHI